MFCWPDLPGRKDFDKGFAAYECGDHAAVLREWFPLAEQELATAQHTLSVYYKIGLEVPRVYVEAYQWADLSHALNIRC